MVPVEVRTQPHVSFTQIDQYLRCPLKYRFLYIDRLEPDFVPVALAFGSGIHDAAAFFFRGAGQGERPSVADVQGYFEALWKLESEHRPLRFGEKETKESLLDLATRMLAVLCAEFDPRTEVVAVEQPFAVPLIDQETGEVLERDLVGTLDLLERGPRGPARRRGPQDLGAPVHGPPGRGLAPALGLQLRDRAPRLRRPGGGTPQVRCADEDSRARAAPVLDDARPRGQRAPVQDGGGGAGGDRGGRVPPGGRVAVQGVPVQEQVLGVGVGGARPR